MTRYHLNHHRATKGNHRARSAGLPLCLAFAAVLACDDVAVTELDAAMPAGDAAVARRDGSTDDGEDSGMQGERDAGADSSVDDSGQRDGSVPEPDAGSDASMPEDSSVPLTDSGTDPGARFCAGLSGALFCDDFEDGLSKWTPRTSSGTVALDTARAAQGSASLKSSLLNGNAQEARVVVALPDSLDEGMTLYAQMRVFMPSTAFTKLDFVWLGSTTGTSITVEDWDVPNGTPEFNLFPYNGVHNSWIGAAPLIGGQWQCVELRIVLDENTASEAAVGSLEIRLDDAVAVEKTGIYTFADGAPYALEVGLSAGHADQEGYSAWFDNIVVSTDPLPGCDGTLPPPEDGGVDAGPTVDGGSELDGGSEADAGFELDAGSEMDASGGLDAALPDSGSLEDAAVLSDASSADAGDLADAGTDPDAGSGGGDTTFCDGVSGALFCDDFEQDLSMWTSDTASGAVTLDSTQAYDGLASLKSALTGTGASQKARVKVALPDSLDEGQTLYAQMRMFLPNTVYRKLDFMWLGSSTGTSASLEDWDLANGTPEFNLFPWNNVHNDWIGAGSLSGDQWHCVEFRITLDANTAAEAATGAVEIFIDGASAVSKTSIYTFTDGDPYNLELGMQAASLDQNAFEAWFDNVVVSTDPLPTCD